MKWPIGNFLACYVIGLVWYLYECTIL